MVYGALDYRRNDPQERGSGALLLPDVQHPHYGDAAWALGELQVCPVEVVHDVEAKADAIGDGERAACAWPPRVTGWPVVARGSEVPWPAPIT